VVVGFGRGVDDGPPVAGDLRQVGGAPRGVGHEPLALGLAIHDPQAVLGRRAVAARVGLGERNVQIFRKLSAADQVAYNRALLGDDVFSTLAVALETEDLSRTGGCTRKALTETFKPDQLKASHYNPQDALINKDPRMKAAIAFWQREMKKVGFEYGHPDEIEPDLRSRLSLLTEGGKLLVTKMSQDQKAALRKLQDFERLVSVKAHKLHEEVLTPVEEKIQEELFSRKVQ